MTMILSNLLWNVAGKYHSSGPGGACQKGPYTELECAARTVAEVAAEDGVQKIL